MKSILTSAALALWFGLSGCSHMAPLESKETTSLTPQSVVLIQGVHLDGSSWNQVKMALNAKQFAVHELGRLGRDEKTPASLKNIATLGCATIDKNSVIVGHSYGGAIANEMFGICPDKISKIIYVAAVVPMNGEKPFDKLGKSSSKTYSKAVKFTKTQIVPKSPKKFFSVTDPQVAKNGKYPTLYPEWMSLTAEPVTFDPAKYASLPRVYIFTGKDPVVKSKTQKAYVAAAGIKDTETVQTGHYPMISDPAGLAALIAKWAK